MKRCSHYEKSKVRNKLLKEELKILQNELNMLKSCNKIPSKCNDISNTSESEAENNTMELKDFITVKKSTKKKSTLPEEDSTSPSTSKKYLVETTNRYEGLQEDMKAEVSETAPNNVKERKGKPPPIVHGKLSNHGINNINNN